MQIKDLGQENGLWFQVNLETNPPILIVSNPKTQKQEYIFGELNEEHCFYFDLKKFIEGTTIEINKYKSVFWLRNGELHRENGPARIWSDGGKEWYKNGSLHREDGPAVVHSDGSEFWYKNGKLHREDGPAVVYSNERKEWFLNGKKYSEQEWKNFIKAKQNAD